VAVHDGQILGGHPGPDERQQGLALVLVLLRFGEEVFTSTEVVYGVTGTDVTVLPEYGVSP
jgi:hypothetical protein